MLGEFRQKLSVRRFAGLLADRSGAVAIVFALALIPILGLIGGAIDYGRAYIVKSRLQDALDSAILAAGATTSMSNDERIAYAKTVFAANYPESEMGVPATPNISISEDGVISGTVDADLGAAMLGLVGVDNIGLSATSEASIVSVLKGEIVLVLDYSGSMDQRNKYKTMRTAAIKLIDTLSQDGKNDKVKFGLVPFSAAVYTTLPKAYVVNQSGGGDWTGCTADRRYPYNLQDSTPASGTQTTSDKKTKWGCHIDDVFLDDDDGQGGGYGGGYGGGGGGGYGGGYNQTYDGYEDCDDFYRQCAAYSNNSVVIRSLTNDFSALKTQLKNMRPIGNTHISLGLEFGWHLISPNAPWAEGVAYGTEGVLKGIVLLTDGAQTSSAWGKNDSFKDSNGEDNLEDLCEAIKEKGVVLMTVAFDLDDDETQERLEDCATSASHYFEADSNTDLAAAFDAITSQFVKNLHLSR